MTATISIFWFRRDLRFTDNTGLHQALKAGFPVVPVFIFDSDILLALNNPEDRRVSFIYKAVEELQAVATQYGSTLDVRYGKPINIFRQLLNDYTVQAVFTNGDYEPYAIERDTALSEFLQQQGVSFHVAKDQVIFEKDEVVKPDGSVYQIFTPYSKKWKALLTPAHYRGVENGPLLARLYRQPAKAFPSLQAMGFEKCESNAIPSVDTEIIRKYHQTRDIPSLAGTSRLGVHLRFGTVSIRQLVRTAIDRNAVFLSELIWREFFMQQLWHLPHTVSRSCKPAYDAIPWRNNQEELERWCNGQTGFPIVDAGIRELNATGFMHNRVRMIVGSFLVKDLLIDWRLGEAYFASKLMDYELASNIGNWQWVAGCGCDAAPYFRIFNPEAQVKKFDPQELYIQKWVPEYKTDRYVKPVVDHKAAAARCLQVYKKALAGAALNK